MTEFGYRLEMAIDEERTDPEAVSEVREALGQRYQSEIRFDDGDGASAIVLLGSGPLLREISGLIQELGTEQDDGAVFFTGVHVTDFSITPVADE